MKILIIITIINGCQKDIINDLPNNIEHPEFTRLNSIKDDLGYKIAKNLALSMHSVEIRDFIKINSIKKFDGDYNFLIELLKNNPIKMTLKNGREIKVTFGDVLTGNLSNPVARIGSNNEFLDSLAKYFPLVQIAIPALLNKNANNWDTNETIPLVAFVPSEIKNNIIPAFDTKGNYHELSALDEPENLVVVISENERIMALEKHFGSAYGRSVEYPMVDGCPLTQDPYYENEQYFYYFRSDAYNELNQCTGGERIGGGSGNGQGNIVCDRDRKSGKDRLYRMIFNSMSDFKDVNEWFDGGQDIEVTIFFGQANGAISKITKAFSGRDRDFKKCGLFKCEPEWFDLGDVEVVTWDKDIYGNAMLYSWVEKDGGNVITVNNSFSSTYENDDGTKSTYSFSVKNTIQDKDDRLYESIVEYCDNTDDYGYTYNTGKIRFQVRQFN